MRKLVTIQEIKELVPIEGKDRIQLARVLGWWLIVKKGEFEVGDLGVFFEIDSFLPKEDRYAFLGKTTKYLGNEGYRIKTMKMGGVISQGLILPLSFFYENLDKPIGTEVTELLKVVKYDVELVENANSGRLSVGKPSGSFPSFIPKTDQTRIQSLPMFFNMYKDMLFEETLKLDGSSCTMYKIKAEKTGWFERVKKFFGFDITYEHFGVCSRNLEIIQSTDQDKKSDFWAAAEKYQIKKHLPVGYAIQGEVIAPNIQSNHEKVTSVEFYIFDVYNITEQRYLLPTERQEFVKTYLPTAKHIPITTKEIAILQLSLEDILSRVEGQSINPGTISEGRVYKSLTDPSISFKAISNKYLLKEK